MIYLAFKFYQENKELFSAIKDLIEFVGLCIFVLKCLYKHSLSRKDRDAVLAFEYKNKQNLIEFIKTKSYLKANIKDRYIFIILYAMAGLVSIYLTMSYFENPKIYIDCSFIIFFIMSFVKAKDDKHCYIKFIKK